MTRWLVTGAGGMLGRDLVDRLSGEGEEVIGLGHGELDLTDPDAARSAVDQHGPNVVVNCAAWTDVDAAESHEPEALAVNGDGVRRLAEACAGAGARLVHVSTDYVFAGDGNTPYDEDAPTDPRTAYGRTKVAGERAVRELLPDAGAIVRTAWLYGAHGKNFVSTMIRLQAERETVDVVTDQRGQPTCSQDVAARLAAVGRDRDAAGVYHATNTGEASWYDLAREVFALAGADPERVRSVTSAAFPRPAPRPSYSALGQRRWTELGLEPLREWRSALRVAFESMR